MTHKLIKTYNYLLVVDDSEIKDCYYWNELDQEIRKNNNINHPYHKKITSHLPLNGSPILEGVDLLPPYSRHQEDGVEELFKEEHEQAIRRGGQEYAAGYYEGLHDGYNKAKEKYKYTDEDMREAISQAYKQARPDTEYELFPLFYQYPTEFEKDDYQMSTLSNGQQVWVGKYK